ncbi:MAG: hypothetical protein OIF58_13725 [Cohaesibacter sp.]|nr:hypothetical protein [Cohaesibacter sp.]
MNVTVFGTVIAAIGCVIILLSVSTVLSNRTAPDKYYHYSAENRRVTDEARAHMTKCIYSRIGETRGFGGGCPMGGYSALVTYLGLSIAAVGGGLIIASRQPPQSREVTD